MSNEQWRTAFFVALIILVVYALFSKDRKYDYIDKFKDQKQQADSLRAVAEKSKEKADSLIQVSDSISIEYWKLVNSNPDARINYRYDTIWINVSSLNDTASVRFFADWLRETRLPAVNGD